MAATIADALLMLGVNRPSVSRSIEIHCAASKWSGDRFPSVMVFFLFSIGLVELVELGEFN